MATAGREKLSSGQTFIMKFIFPVLWSTLFGIGAATLWFVDFPAQKAPPGLMKWGFLIGWIVGTISIWFICTRLKRVEIDASRLYISNFVREEAVPFDWIEAVSENRWINPRQVKIVFRQDTAFGRAVVFIPRTRFFKVRHPVVGQLQRLAGIAPLP